MRLNLSRVRCGQKPGREDSLEEKVCTQRKKSVYTFCLTPPFLILFSVQTLDINWVLWYNKLNKIIVTE